MVRSLIATQAKRSRRPESDTVTPAAPEPTDVGVSPEASAEAPEPKQLRTGPGVRLWGFVRRHEDVHETIEDCALLPLDIAIWYDKNENRFQIVADHKMIDDLAPVEFVQFVRALRFSATQILFKIENRTDGLPGRPVCVWAAQIQPVIPLVPARRHDERRVSGR